MGETSSRWLFGVNGEARPELPLGTGRPDGAGGAD
jgi:hypothetical protein